MATTSPTTAAGLTEKLVSGTRHSDHVRHVCFNEYSVQLENMRELENVSYASCFAVVHCFRVPHTEVGKGRVPTSSRYDTVIAGICA